MAEAANRARRPVLTWRNFERAGLVALWLALLVAGLAGYFGMRDWRLELFANFKMQYYLGALLFCVVAAWRKYYVILGLNVVLLLWNGYEIFNFAPQSYDPGQHKVYRALSANVYTRNYQVERVEAWIREQEPDFVALIEITGDWRPTLENLKDILPYQSVEMWGGAYGAAVLSRYPPVPDRKRAFAGVGSIPCVFQTENGPLNVVLIHPLSPTNERSWKWRGDALMNIESYVKTVEAKAPVLVMGDMNTTPWSPFYKRFVSQSELDPVVTSFLPRRTWPTRNPLLWIPIDHFFVTDNLKPVEQWIGPDLGSDHYPIALDFYFATQSK